MARANAPKKIACLIYPGFEMLDFYGPVSVFGNPKIKGSYEILTVSQTAGAVPSSREISTVTDYDYESCPRPDILLVPGTCSSPRHYNV